MSCVAAGKTLDMRLLLCLAAGLSALTSLAPLSSAHPLQPRDGPLEDTCWESIRNPVYNEYWVNITNDAAYNEAPWCGAKFLDFFRGWCGIITDWQCNYDGGAAIMYFKTVMWCSRWKVTQAIHDASSGERHVNCWEGFKPWPGEIVWVPLDDTSRQFC